MTEIGDRAFQRCRALVEVVIPCSVESIGEGAFCGCINLEKAILPENTRLGDDVFDGCVKMKK